MHRSRSWKEWFSPPDQAHQPTDQEIENQVRMESGAGHSDIVPQNGIARCVTCREVMTFEDGMYISISGDWRLHISCFNEQLERHWENGEVVDLTTGAIEHVEVEHPVEGIEYMEAED